MIRVLVTGVGSGIGQSILKCFQDSDYKVVGADADPLAAGLYAVPKSYRIPLATLKNWEQGRRAPDAPAAAYLLAILRRPKEVMEAVAG